MHDIAVLGVFEEPLFLIIENNSVLRNRLGERLRGAVASGMLDLSPCPTPAPACGGRFRRCP